MKEFLCGVISVWILVVVVYLFREWLRKKCTYTTKHGLKVYDMGMRNILGWTLPRDQIEYCCEIFNFEFDEHKITNNFIDGVNLVCTFCPTLHPDGNDAGFVFGYRKGMTVGVGVQPVIWKTVLAHELMHMFAWKATGDPDHFHKIAWMWEAGAVGFLNKKLKERFPIEDGMISS